MKKCALVLALLLIFASCTAAFAESTKLTVNGTGVVSVLADQVSVTLGVTETNEDVKLAQESVNGKINAICEALIAAGVEEKNIGTSRISIDAEYSDSLISSSAKITGYTVSNTVTLQSKDIDSVGGYIDVAFAAGANTLDSIEFSSSNTETAKLEALKLAVQNASEKANTMAEAMNMTISGVVQVSESDSYSYNSYGAKTSNYRLAESADSATVVRAATLEIQAQVEIEYEMTAK